MVKYIKCPRCELNYIDSEKQEYCDVCLAELKGKKLQFADLEDEDFEAVDAELDAEELCPVCGVNPLRAGEKMCEACKAQQEYEEENVDLENDEEWKNYLEEDTDEDLTVDEELQEEIEEEFAQDDEEEEYVEDDFYESEDVDSLSDLEDDEYDDDEEEDDDDDDF